MLSRDVFLRRFKSSLSWLRGLAAAKKKQNFALSKWAVLFFLALPQPRKQCLEALGKTFPNHIAGSTDFDVSERAQFALKLFKMENPPRLSPALGM